MKIRKLVATNGKTEETIYTTNFDCKPEGYYFPDDFEILSDEKVENGKPVWLYPHEANRPHEFLRRRKNIMPISPLP